MPRLSALIHTANDEARLGRLLESLRACDDILVVDHGSQDRSRKIAREHGARVKKAVPGVDDGSYAVDCRHAWVLCLLPGEALSEELEAALLQWKETDPGATVGYTVQVRESTEAGWLERERELRLANRECLTWSGRIPSAAPEAAELAGDLLRLVDAKT